MTVAIAAAGHRRPCLPGPGGGRGAGGAGPGPGRRRLPGRQTGSKPGRCRPRDSPSQPSNWWRCGAASASRTCASRWCCAAPRGRWRPPSRRTDTRVVLGMGGYVTVPAAAAARRPACPSSCRSRTRYPGWRCAWPARRARASVPRPARSGGAAAPRAVLTGNPLRPALARFDRAALAAEARRRYELPEGAPGARGAGGQPGGPGAQRGGGGIVAAWRGSAAGGGAPGGSEAPAVAPQAAAAPLPWRCLPFEEQMEFFYAAADLVVCRAGAMTISELSRHRDPRGAGSAGSVGQQHNAACLVEAGARAWWFRPTRRGCRQSWAACWPTRQLSPRWPRGSSTFQKSNTCPPGYSRSNPWARTKKPYRIHLRLLANGSGMLILNASTVLHLNPTVAEYAYHFVRGTDPERGGNQVSKRYRVSRKAALADYKNMADRIDTLIHTPDLDPVSYLDFERVAPHSTDLTSLLRLDSRLYL